MNFKLLLFSGLIANSLNNNSQAAELQAAIQAAGTIDPISLNKLLITSTIKASHSYRIKRSILPIEQAVAQEKKLSTIANEIIEKGVANEILTKDEIKSVLEYKLGFAKGFVKGYMGNYVDNFSKIDQLDVVYFKKIYKYHVEFFGRNLQHHLLIVRHADQLLRIDKIAADAFAYEHQLPKPKKSTTTTKTNGQVGKIKKTPLSHLSKVKPPF